MRPRSIVQFERVVLLSIAIAILDSFLSWDRTSAAVSAQGLGDGFVIGAQAFSVVIYLLLLWFIARKGSFMARGIYVALAVIGLAMGLFSLRQASNYETVSLIIMIVQLLLSLISIWLLFRPDANAWFSESRRAADPENYQ